MTRLSYHQFRIKPWTNAYTCFTMPLVTTVISLQDKGIVAFHRQGLIICAFKVCHILLNDENVNMFYISLNKFSSKRGVLCVLMDGVGAMSSACDIFNEILVCASKERFVSNHTSMAKCKTITHELLMHKNAIALHEAVEMMPKETEKWNIYITIIIVLASNFLQWRKCVAKEQLCI